MLMLPIATNGVLSHMRTHPSSIANPQHGNGVGHEGVGSVNPHRSFLLVTGCDLIGCYSDTLSIREVKVILLEVSVRDAGYGHRRTEAGGPSTLNFSSSMSFAVIAYDHSRWGATCALHLTWFFESRQSSTQTSTDTPCAWAILDQKLHFAHQACDRWTASKRRCIRAAYLSLPAQQHATSVEMSSWARELRAIWPHGCAVRLSAMELSCAASAAHVQICTIILGCCGTGS